MMELKNSLSQIDLGNLDIVERYYGVELPASARTPDHSIYASVYYYPDKRQMSINMLDICGAELLRVAADKFAAPADTAYVGKFESEIEFRYSYVSIFFFAPQRELCIYYRNLTRQGAADLINFAMAESAGKEVRYVFNTTGN